MRAHDPEGNVFQRRPAESATVLTGAIAIVVAGLITGDVTGEDFAAAVGLIVVSVVPMVVTFVVNRGKTDATQSQK